MEFSTRMMNFCIIIVIFMKGKQKHENTRWFYNCNKVTQKWQGVIKNYRGYVKRMIWISWLMRKVQIKVMENNKIKNTVRFTMLLTFYIWCNHAPQCRTKIPLVHFRSDHRKSLNEILKNRMLSNDCEFQEPFFNEHIPKWVCLCL